MPNKNYDEKRNFIRMRVDTPASVALARGDEQYSGTCVDLSGGGLLVKLKEKISIGTQLTVKIESDHGHSPMLSARTTVTRAEDSKDENGDYEIGLEIDELLAE